MKIAIAADHAGYSYKEKIKAHLNELEHEVIDFGTDSEQVVDYPDLIYPAALALSDGHCERAIVLGGSGNGEAVVANRVPGVRCALCWDTESAVLARRHNDANALSLGARLIGIDEAIAIVNVWLETDFEGGRHTARVAKIESG